jgi:hypothetical protein
MLMPISSPCYLKEAGGNRHADAEDDKDRLRIMFGSCNKNRPESEEPLLDQPFWPIIEENKPDAWIWGGDNVYVDARRNRGWLPSAEAFMNSLSSGMHMLDYAFVPAHEARVGLPRLPSPTL